MDFKLPAPLVAYIRACRLKGFPKCRTSEFESSEEITITWSLASPMQKQTAKKPKKRTSKPPQKPPRRSPIKLGPCLQASEEGRQDSSTDSSSVKETTVLEASPMETDRSTKTSPANLKQPSPKKPTAISTPGKEKPPTPPKPATPAKPPTPPKPPSPTGFETYLRRVVSLSKTLYSPKVLVNYPGSDGSVPT